MSINVAREVALMHRMTMTELRTRYAEVFGDTTNVKNRAWLLKRIAWRLQAREEGSLSDRARRRAEELADDADLRLNAPRDEAETLVPAETQTVTLPLPADQRLPAAGTILTRAYKGRVVQVLIRPDGFEFDGRLYPSLSAVAKAITGSHCNGFLFFKGALNRNGADS